MNIDDDDRFEVDNIWITIDFEYFCFRYLFFIILNKTNLYYL